MNIMPTCHSSTSLHSLLEVVFDRMTHDKCVILLQLILNVKCVVPRYYCCALSEVSFQKKKLYIWYMCTWLDHIQLWWIMMAYILERNACFVPPIKKIFLDIFTNKLNIGIQLFFETFCQLLVQYKEKCTIRIGWRSWNLHVRKTQSTFIHFRWYTVLLYAVLY